MSDDLDTGDSDQEVVVCTNPPINVPPRTPNKNVENLKTTPEVRRSPRYIDIKHFDGQCQH